MKNTEQTAKELGEAMVPMIMELLGPTLKIRCTQIAEAILNAVQSKYAAGEPSAFPQLNTATETCGSVWQEWLKPKPEEGQLVIVKCIDAKKNVTLHAGYFDNATVDAWPMGSSGGGRNSLTYLYGEIIGWIPYPENKR